MTSNQPRLRILQVVALLQPLNSWNRVKLIGGSASSGTVTFRGNFAFISFRAVSTRGYEKPSAAAKFHFRGKVFCRRICRMVTDLMTISAAARHEGIDRRTVQRYCRREPGIMVGKKVNLESLRALIAYCKAGDGRGFPLGKSRLAQWLFKPPRKEKPIFRRRLDRRLEIIAREIYAMTDAEQVQLLQLWPGVFLNFFWQHNIEKCQLSRKELG
jgi:hypothetical protein